MGNEVYVSAWDTHIHRREREERGERVRERERERGERERERGVFGVNNHYVEPYVPIYGSP